MYASLQTLDYVAVVVYIALMAVVGLLFAWIVKDSGSYFKGGGAIPWTMAAVTNFMGLFSTFVFVAYAGVAYEYGLVSISVFWSFVPACIIGGLFFAKRWRRSGYTTPTEYLELRYNFPVREVTSWVGLVMRFLDNMVRLYAIGIFITAVTPLSLEWSIIISGVIVTLFNLFGGMWSVSIMSTIQFVIMILVTLVLLPLSLQDAGGLGHIQEVMPDHLKWFNGPKGAPFWFTVYTIMSIIKSNENWTFIQKYYCVRDEKSAQKTAWVTALLFLVFTPVFLLPAVAGPIIVPGIENPEMSYVAISSKLLPVGIMGILFSSMFAATMSSLNAEYNVMSGVVTHDIYKRLFNKDATDKQMLRVARWSTLIIGIVMTGGAILIQGIGGGLRGQQALHRHPCHTARNPSDSGCSGQASGRSCGYAYHHSRCVVRNHRQPHSRHFLGTWHHAGDDILSCDLLLPVQGAAFGEQTAGSQRVLQETFLSDPGVGEACHQSSVQEGSRLFVRFLVRGGGVLVLRLEYPFYFNSWRPIQFHRRRLVPGGCRRNSSLYT